MNDKKKEQKSKKKISKKQPQKMHKEIQSYEL